MQITITTSGGSNSSGGGGSSGKPAINIMKDNNLLNQLKLVRRNPKSRHSVCAFYKTLPPTPPPDIDCFVSIIFCSKLGKDPHGGPSIPKSVLLEQRVLVSSPPGCNYLSAMGVIEERAASILDEAKAKAGGAQGICIGKLWRTEILTERKADGGNGSVELSDEVWESALTKLGKDDNEWEIIAVFHEPRVAKKKRERLRGRCVVM